MALGQTLIEEVAKPAVLNASSYARFECGDVMLSSSRSFIRIEAPIVPCARARWGGHQNAENSAPMESHADSRMRILMGYFATTLIEGDQRCIVRGGIARQVGIHPEFR
jgi:hypothetical protein